MTKTAVLRRLIFCICICLSSSLFLAQETGHNSWEENYYKGVQLFENKDYDGAIKNLKLSIQNAIRIQIDSLKILSFKKLADVYSNKGEYENGQSVLKRCLELIENQYGSQSEEAADVLLALSIMFKKDSEFKKSIEALERSTTILSNIYGRNSLKLANNKTTLSQIYEQQGYYDKAINQQGEVLTLFEGKEKDSLSYAAAVFTMAYIYQKTRDFEKSIELYQLAKEYLDPNKYSGYILFANQNIAQTYTDSGDYEKAMEYTLRVLKETSPEDMIYSQRLQNMAYLQEKLGDFKQAQHYYDLALSDLINRNKQTDKLYGQLLNNIGKMYRQMGNLEKAQSYFKQALDVFLLTHTEDHIEFGYQLNDYAKTLFDLGEPQQAIELFEKNLKLSERNQRNNTQEHFNWQFNLAEAYNRLGRFEEALPLALNAVENTKVKLGDDHPIYGNMLKGLGLCYIGLNRIDDALPEIQASNEIFIDQIRKVFQFRSEKEKRNFLAVIKGQFDELQSISLTAQFDSQVLNGINLNNQLLLKGLLLNNSKGVLSDLKGLGNETVDNLVLSYRSTKSLLENTLLLPFDQQNYDADSLELAANDLESQLVKLHSSNFAKKQHLIQDWTISRDNLKEDQVMINFSSFNLLRNGRSTDSIMYVAYIYKRDHNNPKRIPICEESQLRKILDGSEPFDIYSNDELYNIIWQPLEKHLSNVKTVFFSPSGLLNQLSMAALIKDDQHISNRFNLVQLSNPNILNQEFREPRMASTLLIGGIEYDYQENTDKARRTNELTYLNNEMLINSKATRSRGESWTYLPGSLEEIMGLKNIYTMNGIPSDIWTGKAANELAFKGLSKESPNVLHIATHGFFFENPDRKPRYGMSLSTEDRYRLAEDPLLRSGIILAGANYAWKNDGNPYEEEDGILSAMEISNLDLSNTDMVVLSACETGLGDIDGSEGVYGLQRAFKMAGVDLIVMSLWQVPDEETAEFMNLFYSNWVEGENLRRAFNRAQRSMQEKYKDEPEKWAAFVLMQ